MLDHNIWCMHISADLESDILFILINGLDVRETLRK